MLKAFIEKIQNKFLIKKFIKDNSGSLILEFVILLAIFGVSVAAISPMVKQQLVETYDGQSKDITYDGHKMDSSIDAAPQTNPLPEVDPDASTN